MTVCWGTVCGVGEKVEKWLRFAVLKNDIVSKCILLSEIVLRSPATTGL